VTQPWHTRMRRFLASGLALGLRVLSVVALNLRDQFLDIVVTYRFTNRPITTETSKYATTITQSRPVKLVWLKTSPKLSFILISYGGMHSRAS